MIKTFDPKLQDLITSNKQVEIIEITAFATGTTMSRGPSNS